MLTLNIRPNAAGDETNLPTQYPSSTYHWDKVDEVVADEDATYVSAAIASPTTGSYRDLYNFGTSPDIGEITGITLYARCKTSYVEAPTRHTHVTLHLKLLDNIYTGLATTDLTASYVNYSDTWAVNPATSSAWIWSDLDDLQAGLTLEQSRFGTGGGIESHGICTQLWIEISYYPRYERSLNASMGMSVSLSRAVTNARSLSVATAMSASIYTEANYTSWLCLASRDNGSIKSKDGTTWTTCAIDSGGRGTLPISYLAQYDNRLCGLNFQNAGFAYSGVNDLIANWTDKEIFPNMPSKFTGLFVGKDASDNQILYFLTPKGMYFLDIFENFVFNPTELTWEEDDTSGKKGLYFRGDNYVAVGKGIYKMRGNNVTEVGPDMDDGLPDTMQGNVVDMIGVGFWLVIAVDGGAGKSSILKKYINGKHWHPVYVGTQGKPIGALCWDSGTLYFGEGTDVKSLPFPAITDNVNTINIDRCASGSLTYPYFHSVFETMPKVAHKCWAVTRDCNTDDYIEIYYRTNENTAWTELGIFDSSPRPDALLFSADGIGVEFDKIQLLTAFVRGGTTTNSPKLESLILEYRVVPPVLWKWNIKVNAVTSSDRKGRDIIEAIKTAVRTKTLMSFYPDGDKDTTEYFVQVNGMPGIEKGTEFGQEGVYS